MPRSYTGSHPQRLHAHVCVGGELSDCTTAADARLQSFDQVAEVVLAEAALEAGDERLGQ